MLLYRNSAGPCPKIVGVAEIQIINGSCDLIEATLLSTSKDVLAVMGVLQHPFCSKASSVLVCLRLDLTEGKTQPLRKLRCSG